MSHKFRLLQLFVGYKFLQFKLLENYREDKQLQSLRPDLRVEYCRRFEMMLQTDMSKSQTQVCQRLIFFRQMCFCPNTSVYLHLSEQLCHLPIDRLDDFKDRYIHRLKKLLLQLSNYKEKSNIFYVLISISLCKYLPKLEFLIKQPYRKAVASS